MKIIHKYQCEVCQTIYDERASAEACEAQGDVPPLFPVGSFVVTEINFGRFGWFDGDPDWVIERDKDFQFRPARTWSLIYVVTAITRPVSSLDRSGYHTRHHDLCYHLATKGMSANGYDLGFTFPDTHLGLFAVDAVLDPNDLVGQLANHLL